MDSFIQALDNMLPHNSFVLLLGLVDGRVLWDNLSSRQHPIGATYEEVYTCLECNEVVLLTGSASHLLK